MKKCFLYGCFCLLLSSCVTTPKPLYTWGNYQERIYQYTKNDTDKSLDDLFKIYQTLIDKQRGTRKTVPPGICADYGYLLYTKGKRQEGIALLNKEMELYPESAVFISRIINKLQNEKE